MVGPLVVLAMFAVAAAWGPAEALIGSAAAVVIFFVVQAFRDRSSASGNVPSGPAWLRIPLALCATIFLLGVAWQLSGYGHVTLASLIEQGRPAGTLEIGSGPWTSLVWPDEHASHAADIRTWVTIIAFLTALGGILLAAVFYGWRLLNADDARRQFAGVYHLLLNKWWFDELYDWLFVRPTLLISQIAAAIDRRWIDGFIDGLASVVQRFSALWDFVADGVIVDGFVNKFAQVMHALGLSLRNLQTGSLRQYVMFLVISTVAIFVIVSFFWGYSFASSN
jgi:NADH-quinone oxidoreductase subunit L